MIKSVAQAPIRGKRVLLRVDFNVPLDNGKIADDHRIRAALPTIKLILSKKPRQLVLMSHLGRPHGRTVSLSLAAVGRHLSKLLRRSVYAAPDCVDVDVRGKSIVLLENLRFHAEEEADDRAFARKLASYGDIYVNDAFGTSHRAHASVHAITRYLPSYAGLLLLDEQRSLSKAVEDLKRPYLAIIGGGKADKISLISSFHKRVDHLFVGGVMANTVLAARGVNIGKSKTDPSAVKLARASGKLAKVLLPIDVVVGTSVRGGKTRISRVVDIKPHEMILDIGPQTTILILSLIRSSKTIFWAGPLGLYEIPAFARGTETVAKALARSHAITIVGGGDSGAVISRLGLSKRVTHVSTGGGASIEYLEGKKLPGIEALR